MTLEKLYKIIENRKKYMPIGSYVASLFADGEDRIIQKVGEEATEVVIAAKNEGRSRQIEEITDLFFHALVLMAQLNISPIDIVNELSRRNKQPIKRVIQ